MMNKIIEELKDNMPLKIEEVDWGAGTFSIKGSNWTFLTVSAWRIVNRKEILFACYDDSVEDKLEYLKGLEIVSVSYQGSLLKIDPIFVLSNGHLIEIFSSCTTKPWTFLLRGNRQSI